MGDSPVSRMNVVRKEEVQGGKVFWRKVGTLVQWADGSMKLNLFMFPQEFHVFPDEKPEGQGPTTSGSAEGRARSNDAQFRGRRK